MQKVVDLRTGNISKALIALAIPLMGMSFIQMAYNLTDMFWIGKLGAGPVASVGTVGQLIWMATGIHTMAQLGGQVFVAQNLGRDDYETAGQYASASIMLSGLISLCLGLVFFFGRTSVVGFFNLNSPDVILGAEQYLSIVGGLVFLPLLAKLFTALITATGNSKSPFWATSAGLIFNIVLDPILIFGWFGLPALGIQGAAIATVLAQAVVLLMLIWYTRKDTTLFANVTFRCLPPFGHFKDIIRLGVPATLQSTLYPLVSMLLSRMVASFGDNAVAVQRIGTQVESISWMTAEGFAIAVNSFVAQNFGAGNFARVKEGYAKAISIVAVWGTFSTAVLFFGASGIIRLFIDDSTVVSLGHDYLVIIALSQLFMCSEIVSGNAMNALGRSMIPAVVVTTFTVLRLPGAMVLTQTALGLNGIWWSVSISSICKGIVLTSVMLWIFRRGVFAPKESPLQ